VKKPHKAPVKLYTRNLRPIVVGSWPLVAVPLPCVQNSMLRTTEVRYLESYKYFAIHQVLLAQEYFVVNFTFFNIQIICLNYFIIICPNYSILIYAFVRNFLFQDLFKYPNYISKIIPLTFLYIKVSSHVSLCYIKYSILIYVFYIKISSHYYPFSKLTNYYSKELPFITYLSN